jgi:hypothetical protein
MKTHILAAVHAETLNFFDGRSIIVRGGSIAILEALHFAADGLKKVIRGLLLCRLCFHLVVGHCDSCSDACLVGWLIGLFGCMAVVASSSRDAPMEGSRKFWRGNS